MEVFPVIFNWKGNSEVKRLTAESIDLKFGHKIRYEWQDVRTTIFEIDKVPADWWQTVKVNRSNVRVTWSHNTVLGYRRADVVVESRTPATWSDRPNGGHCAPTLTFHDLAIGFWGLNAGNSCRGFQCSRHLISTACVDHTSHKEKNCQYKCLVETDSCWQ